MIKCNFVLFLSVTNSCVLLNFKVVGALDADGTQSIEELKQLIETKKRYVHEDIIYIWQNYSFLATAVTKLESTSLSLHESLTIFQDVVNKVAAVSCPIGIKIFNLFKCNIRSNPNLTEMIIVDEFANNIRSCLPQNFCVSEEDVQYYKLCLLTSVDVERSFSRFKNIYRDNRSFQFENLSKFVFVNCNSAYKK